MADGPIELPALRRLLDVIGGDRDDLSELIDDFISGAIRSGRFDLALCNAEPKSLAGSAFAG